ncbi:hypothetical protein ACFL5V_04465 [Fibrobacterota bacterium]
MKEKSIVGISFKITGLMLIAVIGYGIYMSFRGSASGPFLELALAGFFLFCLAAVFEAWWRLKAPREERPDLAGMTSELAALPGMFTDAITAHKDDNRRLIENISTSLKGLTDRLETISGKLEEHSVRTLKAAEQTASGIKERETEFLKTVSKAGRDSLDELKAVSRNLNEKQSLLSEELLKHWSSTVQETLHVFNDRIADMGKEIHDLMKGMTENASRIQEGFTKPMIKSQDSLVKNLDKNLQSQEKQFTNIGEKMTEMAESLERSSTVLEESGNLAHVNQAGLQAGIEMLNTGLAEILEKMDALAKSPADERDFMHKLYSTLESFHEKATEILIDNALKTREILAGGDIFSKDQPVT